MSDGIKGALLPLRVKTALSLLKEEMTGGVQAGYRAAVEKLGEAVPGEHIQTVVHDQSGRVDDQVQDALELRPDAPARGLRPAPPLPGQPVQVPALGLVQTKDPGQRVQDVFGGLGRAALLQAHVVVDADSGQVRDLFTAQPLDATAAVQGDADGRRIDPGAPGPEKTSKVVHASQYGVHSTLRRLAKVVLPLPGSPFHGKKSP